MNAGQNLDPGAILKEIFEIVYCRKIELELKNIVVMIRYLCDVKNLLAIKINLLVKGNFERNIVFPTMPVPVPIYIILLISTGTKSKSTISDIYRYGFKKNLNRRFI